MNIMTSILRIDFNILNALICLIVPHPEHHDFIFDKIKDYLKHHKFLKLVMFLGLALLRLQSRVCYFTAFSNLSQRQKNHWLKNHSTPWRNLTLKILSLPIKLAYLQNPALHKKLGSRIQLPKVVAEKFRWQQQIVSFQDLEDNLEVDVVVIGTGAGGAAAAYELASKGLAVLIVEEGEYYDRSHFDGNIPKLLKSLYRKMGMTASFGNTVIPIPLGRNVGGTTTINSGTCLRTPKHVLDSWKTSGLSNFTAEELIPWYQQVEDILQVQPADDKSVGEINNIITQGAKSLGLKDLHILSRNAVGCDGQGLCQLGCPTDAKRSTNMSYIPRALEAGAMLATGTKATKLHWQGKKIVGVTLSNSKNENITDKKNTINVKTATTVVAMGSLLTPSFLASNGIKNKWLGKNLSIHPCGAVHAHFPDKNLSNSQTIPQGFGVSDYKDQGLMLEGATPPLAAYGLMLKEAGSDFINKVLRYQQTSFFGFMIKDDSRGRVFSKKFNGLPLVYYKMNNHDLEKFMKGIVSLIRIYLAAGAKEVEIAGSPKLPVIRNEHDIEKLLSLKLKPRDFLISAYHPLGSCRMANSSDLGVVDTNLQVHDKQGLYVMDGSVIPSSLGANPQLTIMAIASRSAAQLANTLLNTTN